MSKRAPKPVPKDEWGPRAWYWLHTSAIYYPAHPTAAAHSTMFARFWSFVQNLPCPECRLHAIQYAREYPPDFSGTDRFQTWAWRFHNAVNHRLGKPLLSAEEYRQAYAEELGRAYWRWV